MSEQNFDIVVVGAGLVGLAAAIAFVQTGKTVCLIGATQMLGASQPEIKLEKSWDARIYALTPATEIWLKSLGVWQHVDTVRVSDIHAMHLWHEGAESPLILADSDAHLTKLGLIAENCNLVHALQASIDAASGVMVKKASCKKIEHGSQKVCLWLNDDTQIYAKLLVAADGGHSFVRQQMQIATHDKKFHQTAIVANYYLRESGHHNVAHQWFGAHETLALLPLPENHVSMVWSLSTERAAELLLLTSAQLAERVQVRSQNRVGSLQQVGNTMSFPLNQSTAAQLIAERVVLVGDASHQVHPMAGQGVNLGFRDVIAVQKLLAKSHAMQDIGERGFLREYERARKADIVSMNVLTSGLDTLFASEQSVLKKLTSFGMQQLGNQNAMKRMLIKQAVN